MTEAVSVLARDSAQSLKISKISINISKKGNKFGVLCNILANFPGSKNIENYFSARNMKSLKKIESTHPYRFGRSLTTKFTVTDSLTRVSTAVNRLTENAG